MKLETKQKWVDALRSGAFKQGKRYLSKVSLYNGEVEHCCLGVLCQIAVKDGVIDPPEKAFDGVFVYEAYERFTLPPTVMEWAGIHAHDPLIDYDNEYSATSKNDSGSSFEEIADLIEANL